MKLYFSLVTVAEWLVHLTAMQEVLQLKLHPIVLHPTSGKVTGCHAGHQEVGRCHTRAESKGIYHECHCLVRIRLITLALKPRGDVTRSPKQWYQWPHKTDLCPPKIKKISRVHFFTLTVFLLVAFLALTVAQKHLCVKGSN